MAFNARTLSDLTSTDRERFWSKVAILSTDQCWLWKAGLTSGGYGFFNVGKYNQYRSHRLAYYFTHGEDPGKLMVCHRCDNPPCCNPYHLFLGTHQDNVADRVLKGRTACGERNGSRKHPESISRGSARPLAKLTESKIVTIREQLCSGIPVKTLAAVFGVSQSVIYAIRKREIWKHVT